MKNYDWSDTEIKTDKPKPRK